MNICQEILDKNVTNRYQAKDENNYLLHSENFLSKYLGKKYCLGVNSGASAIFLALMAIKEKIKNRIVYSNCFTFSAVPSAIVHAGLDLVMIETDSNLVLNLNDLENKIKKLKGNCLVLSYMRGFIPNIDKVLQICEKYDVLLIEDAAHAYGIKYENKKICSFGLISTISTQSNKLINSGEGGFVLTDDPDIMAYCMISSGCYETNYLKHGTQTPPKDSILKYLNKVPNFSLRMSNIQGGVIYQQLGNLENLIEKINKSHLYICNYFDNNNKIEIIQQTSNVRPVYDSIQFRLYVSNSESDKIIKILESEYKIQRFNDIDNARYYKSWQFLDEVKNNPNLVYDLTDKNLNNVFDMRLKHSLTEEELNKFCVSLEQAINQSTTFESHLH